MDNQPTLKLPVLWPAIQNKCQEIGFDMPADLLTGSLLKTLIATKPAGNILELGTGIGSSLCWMVEGMDTKGKITSIDNDPKLIQIAKTIFSGDPRVQLLCENGEKWLPNYQGPPFDLIFADAWPGKYSHLDITLGYLKPGGLYTIDDMSPQPNWPDGHHERAEQLIEQLHQRADLILTKLDWSTGVIIATKTLS